MITKLQVNWNDRQIKAQSTGITPRTVFWGIAGANVANPRLLDVLNDMIETIRDNNAHIESLERRIDQLESSLRYHTKHQHK